MKKILVIEDELSIRENLIELLTLNKYEVIEASTGKEGVIAAFKNKPDLILCDIMMPEMDGYEVLRLVRQNIEIGHTPFVFLTAKTNTDDVRAGMNLGADDYVVKPFVMNELLSAISTRIDRHLRIKNTLEKQISRYNHEVIASSLEDYEAPLSGILGLSELLLKYLDTFDKKEILEIAEGIYNSGKKLNRSLSNMLLYNAIQVRFSNSVILKKLTTGIIRINPTLIKNMAIEIAEKYNRKAHLLIELEDAMVKISEDNLKKILEELIENAFKFSKNNSQVKITGLIHEKCYHLMVEDEGIGMNESEIKIIGPFIQFQASENKETSSGLGLFLAKSLIEFNEGTLNISSDPGKGTMMIINLNLV